MTSISGLGLPPVPDASLPADVRNGSAKDKQNYKTAIGFEQMLVSQLVKGMAGTAGAPDADSDSDDGGDTATTTNPLADGPYASTLQDTLSTALTSGNGLGLARQLYKEMRS